LSLGGTRTNGRWSCRGPRSSANAKIKCGWVPHHPLVAQMLKRAGKRTWRPQHVVRAMAGGGEASGFTDGVASTAGLGWWSSSQSHSVCRPA
jgi:hypothetical protein